MDSDLLLIPGETCWRVERADQLACILDGAGYFYQGKPALLRAPRRVPLIGRAFDTRTPFARRGKPPPGPKPPGPFPRWLGPVRPTMD